MMDVTIAFVLSMAAWFYVIWYIIKGEASQVNASLLMPMYKKPTKR